MKFKYQIIILILAYILLACIGIKVVIGAYKVNRALSSGDYMKVYNLDSTWSLVKLTELDKANLKEHYRLKRIAEKRAEK
jgi:hypothetical protein